MRTLYIYIEEVVTYCRALRKVSALSNGVTSSNSVYNQKELSIEKAEFRVNDNERRIPRSSKSGLAGLGKLVRQG